MKGLGGVTAVGLPAVAGLGLAALTAVHPLAGTALAVAVVGALVLASRPELTSLLIIGVIYSNAVVVGIRMHGLPVVAAALVPLALAVPVVHRALRGEPVRIPPAVPLLALFLAVQALSAVATTDPAAAAEEVLNYAIEGAGLFLLLSMALASTRQLRDAVWVIVLVGGALGAMSVFQQLTGQFDATFGGLAQTTDAVLAGTEDQGRFTNADGRTGVPRLAGPIGDQNRYAQVLLVLVPLGLALAKITRRPTGRVLALVATGFILAGTTLTYSRGAAVALVGVTLVGVALRLVRARVLVGLVVAALVVLVTVPTYGERLASLEAVGGASSTSGVIETGSADGAIRGRATQNFAALLAMRENPALGVGPGAFPTQYRTYAERVGGRPRLEQREAHNLYLGIGAELGVLGLGCFLAIVGVVLRDLWRARKDSLDPLRAELATGFLLAVMLYLASGAFLHLSYQRYLWLLLALASVAGAVRTTSGGAPSAPGVRRAGTEPVAVAPVTGR